MNKQAQEPLINFWYRALHSPRGIELICSSTEATRAKLYALRREAKDLDLQKISLSISPFDPHKL
jgi:hypothetical protein